MNFTPVELETGEHLMACEDITERKRAEEALRRRAEELAALNTTLLDIISPHDLPTLLQTIVERAALLLKAESGGLYLCDPEKEEVCCVVSFNTPENYKGTILKYGEGAAGTVVQTGQPLIIDDYRTWSGRAIIFEGQKPFTAVLSVPMIWQGQVTGVIHVLANIKSHQFTQADLELLSSFANYAAIAVENARLYDSAKKELVERKKTEEALRQSEEKYRTILENIEDGYYETDLPGNLTFFNDSLCRMLGYSKDEMMGMSNKQYTDEENRKKLFAAFNEVYRTGKPAKGFDWQVFTKDGRTLFGEVSVSLIKDSKGQPIGFRGIARDITERKRAEEEIMHTLSLLNATLESTADGILVVDREGKIESFESEICPDVAYPRVHHRVAG